jgi:hypothetical protein
LLVAIEHQVRLERAPSLRRLRECGVEQRARFKSARA